ncbi:MAG: hypothetical protein E6G06_09485 [Actinobacteria bacterium]|nr:MAG: hypothetical protein E6G06_09485 [Actinomycetota bacterium]
MKPTRLLAAALLVVSGLAGCGGSSHPATVPDGPPNTGLPVAKRAQDVVNQQNQRTGQLEQQTGSGSPAGP